MSADVTTINFGQKATLTVTATNATQVAVTGSDGSTLASCAPPQGCQVNPKVTTTYTATATGTGGQATSSLTITVNPATISSINHVVIMLQENRSFDSYFGKLKDFMANATPPYPQAGQVDGIPTGCDGSQPNSVCPAQLTNNSGVSPYHSGSVCMENMSPDWAEDRHEVNLNNPSGVIPGNASTMPMDGFVNTAAGISTQYSFLDTGGKRAMGFYTDHELNYYYFMAANFATSDRFYSPAPTNTPNNRIYMFGATSQGTVHTPGGSEACSVGGQSCTSSASCSAGLTCFIPTGATSGTCGCASNAACGQGYSCVIPTGQTFGTCNEIVQIGPNSNVVMKSQLPNAGKPIFQLLDQKQLSWKIYITDLIPTFEPGNGNFPLDAAVKSTYLQFFSYIDGPLVNGQPSINPAVLAHMAPLDCTGGTDPVKAHPRYICPAGVTDYFTDVKNGTLPAVAFIETGGFTGRDEHPSGRDLSSTTVTCPAISPLTGQTCIDIQVGANFVSQIINALMVSPSWNDSVFFWAMDEGGGAFDHVPPMQVKNPDGLPPILCQDKDVKVGGDFTITGFRIPMMVISPFTKKNFVSHLPMDYTAILKFIETRWNLPNLTLRDQEMPDMSSEFFDFVNVPWLTPPPLQQQHHNSPCNFSLE